MMNLPNLSRQQFILASLVALVAVNGLLLIGGAAFDPVADAPITDAPLRNPGYPETYIQSVQVDLSSPDHFVKLTWAGPNAASQRSGPFRSSPGKGLGDNNCDDLGESNRVGSQCTPKGVFVVEGFSDSLATNSNAKFVTWLDMRRGVALHYFPTVPPYPASAGCIRTTVDGAQLIHDNSIVGKTLVEVGGRWTRAFDREKFRVQLAEHEGTRESVYEDSLGIPTIGVGFNLRREDASSSVESVGADYDRLLSGDDKLDDKQIAALLDRDIEEVLKQCHLVFPKFDELSDVRQRVLADMMFNLGPVRFRSFKKMIAAVEEGDFEAAADEMENSKWHDQVKSRAVRLEGRMRTGVEEEQQVASKEELVIDSQMSRAEAFEGVRSDCPESLKGRLELVSVEYYSFDGKLHQGQLVVDREVSKDLEIVFGIARDYRFPIGSVIPISHADYRLNGVWDDALSMEANNTSAFNYRETPSGRSLSKHAWGRAVDVNPMQNPYVSRGKMRPNGSSYDPAVPGTLSVDHPVVQAFTELGWEWGGSWKGDKDYQHFEKPL
ncbi:M15 family metallopeptidase [Lacipirellula sp.]|uniref:M15 family metallopeptidase n=1 Tax=Lacipirellula sp. TaxID=2691419 RepID=UPI003D12ACA6